MAKAKAKSKKKKSNIIIQENPEERIKLVEAFFFKGVFNDNVTDTSYN